MSLKTELSKSRDEFWVKKVKSSFIALSDFLISYQVEEEYVSQCYNVKLMPIYDDEQDIIIRLVINDKIPESYEEWFDLYITCFKKAEGVNEYLKLFSEKLHEEEFDIISCCSDFSEELMKEDRDIVLLEAVI